MPALSAALAQELGADTPDQGWRRTLDGTWSVRYRGQKLRSPKVGENAGERSVGSGELLDRVRPVLRAAGITRLANITGLDDLGIPVTLAIRPNGRTLSNSAGKGLTLDDAFASAAMEALELYHAEEWTTETERATYYEAFRHLNAPSPDRLPMTGWAPFLPEWHYEWVRGWDLVGHVEVALPAAMVRMGDRHHRLQDLWSFQVTSNGLASGSNLLEAVHSALLEVVERDAVTCWQHRWDDRGQPPPIVSQAAQTSDVVLDLLSRLSARGASVLLLDCTVDTNIPVYMALLHGGEAGTHRMYKGFGAHLDPAVAMTRAITEACQARAVAVAGSRDDLFRYRITGASAADHVQSVRAMQRASEDLGTGVVPDSQGCATFEDDVALMLDRLCHAGLEQTVVVDLGKPYLPVSVVKVVVPGMEGYMAEDYAPGPRALAFAGRDD